MANERDDLAEALEDVIQGGDMVYEDMASALILRGYRKQRTITTVGELTRLFALDIVLYDDSENGGLIETYIVPDDGTVCFRDPAEFHFQDFAGNYVYAKDMPLPVTVLREDRR